jgi:hypothetical protein
MALTPEKRKALKLARRIIEDNKSYFICIALDNVESDYPGLTQACFSLRSYIAKKLGSHHTLDSWSKSKARRGSITVKQGRALRLAWIDWMLGD